MMRILITTWSSRRVGGTETYLGRVMALLHEKGHEVGFCFELDEPADRAPIPVPQGAVQFHVAGNRKATLAAVGAWQPHVIYAHGMLDPELEEHLLQVAPGVFFAHSYYGTCISGEKTNKFPVVQPCNRQFGAGCLAHYFPRRCGGWSPVTMVRAFRRESHRLRLMRRYATVLTHSEHMREEFARHGAAAGRVLNLSYSVTGGGGAPPPRTGRAGSADTWQLSFVGRMDPLKGGKALLDALPRVVASAGRPVHVTFAGDGPARADWETQARAVMRAHPRVTVEFSGWLQPPALASRLDATDILVVPSLWPEPFGLVGPEANRRGVPVVAYATGGIPEWLKDGVNGCLAPGDPPTVNGLAEAILRCLASLRDGDDLRQGALRLGHERADDVHLDALVGVLEHAAAGGRATV